MELTENESKLLEFFSQNRKASLSDAAKSLGSRRQNIHYLLLKLEAKKLITKTPFVPRSIRLTQRGRDAL